MKFRTVFMFGIALGAGLEIGKMLPFMGMKLASKRFRNEIKGKYQAEYARREQGLRVVPVPDDAS